MKIVNCPVCFEDFEWKFWDDIYTSCCEPCWKRVQKQRWYMVSNEGRAALVYNKPMHAIDIGIKRARSELQIRKILRGQQLYNTVE